jgi:hypothetical protein
VVVDAGDVLVVGAGEGLLRLLARTTKTAPEKARCICKRKADGVIHCLLLMFPEFLRARLSVDTELDRLPRLTRPANVFDRGYNEDCTDHASQNREHRH